MQLLNLILRNLLINCESVKHSGGFQKFFLLVAKNFLETLHSFTDKQATESSKSAILKPRIKKLCAGILFSVFPITDLPVRDFVVLSSCHLDKSDRVTAFWRSRQKFFLHTRKALKPCHCVTLRCSV